MTVHVAREVQVTAHHPTDTHYYGTVVLEPMGLNRAAVRVIGEPYAVDLHELERAIELVREEARRAGYQS